MNQKSPPQPSQAFQAKRELRIFLMALLFYTRLPVPRWVGYEASMQQRTSGYFPLIGWLVGGVGALVYWLAQFIWPLPLALLLSMMATVLLTGAMHEDGLADACDGFGGGWSRAQILAIMKDSRLGLFGLVGVGFVLSLKFLTLTYLNPDRIPAVLLAGHSLSRFMALTLMATHAYVRQAGPSKAKSMTQKLSGSNLGIAGFFGLLPLLTLGLWAFVLVLPLLLVTGLLGRYFEQRIGGYTGDCLGATQQIVETALYLLVLAFRFE